MRKKWQKKLFGFEFLVFSAACSPDITLLPPKPASQFTFFIVVTFWNYFMIMRVLLTRAYLSVQINVCSPSRNLAPKDSPSSRWGAKGGKEVWRQSSCLLDCKNIPNAIAIIWWRNVTGQTITTLWRQFHDRKILWLSQFSLEGVDDALTEFTTVHTLKAQFVGSDVFPKYTLWGRTYFFFQICTNEQVSKYWTM